MSDVPHDLPGTEAEWDDYLERVGDDLPSWALSITQTAQELDVSEGEVRALIARGQLAAIGGRIVTRAALASYLRRRDDKAPNLTSYGTVGGTTDEDLAAWAERQRPTPEELEEQRERLDQLHAEMGLDLPDDQTLGASMREDDLDEFPQPELTDPWARGPAEAGQYLTPNEAGERLGMAAGAVMALVAGGELEAIRAYGNAIRIPMPALESFQRGRSGAERGGRA